MTPNLEPPYTAVIFTSTRTEQGADGEYDAMAARMANLAAEQPGFLGLDSTRGPEGLGISVSYWRTPEDARAWKRDVEHREAQRLGIEEWYAAYRLRVATVEREYGRG